jgi:hypothetical protein
MTRIRLITAITAAAFATAALPMLSAQAKGDFDGIWQMNVAGAGAVDQAGRHSCPPLHVTLDVQDGKFTGTLERGYGDKVVNGYDQNASPVTGTVDSAGIVNLDWKGVAGTGTATQDHMSVSWTGDCGPRTALGDRY